MITSQKRNVQCIMLKIQLEPFNTASNHDKAVQQVNTAQFKRLPKDNRDFLSSTRAQALDIIDFKISVGFQPLRMRIYKISAQ